MLAVPAGQRRLDDCLVKELVLVHAKLVVFGIGYHDDYHHLAFIMPFAREAAAQGGDEVGGLVDAIAGSI